VLICVTPRVRCSLSWSPTLRAIPDIVDARNPTALNVSFPAGVSVVLRIRFRVVLRVPLPCIVFFVLPGLRLAVSPGMCVVGMSTFTQLMVGDGNRSADCGCCLVDALVALGAVLK